MDFDKYRQIYSYTYVYVGGGDNNCVPHRTYIKYTLRIVWVDEKQPQHVCRTQKHKKN